VTTRREFFAGAFAGAAALGSQRLRRPAVAQDAAAQPVKAMVAITFDLEMSRHFPRWEDTHWDYEKGNLTPDVKRYAVEAARRVKASGGRMHFFVVGRVLEHESVEWLEELVREGHTLGNHTYDHVNVLARRPEEVQFRFQRAPWLMRGKTPAEVVRENIELCRAAMKTRLGLEPAGFRTPGGFAEGLGGREDVQRMLLDLGYRWVSSKYPAHPNSKPGEEPAAEVLDGIVKAQDGAQPFAYPSGLVEVPMSPISDVNAFRTGRWKLEWFLRATRLGLEWSIERGKVFDFLAHPSVLVVVDPELRAVDLICEVVRKARERAEIVDLEAIGARVKRD
jgi:peptidoglycan/xylan/chitin deacetylase (PgdA/CDA1 family)